MLRPREAMTNQFPVDQIATFINGHSRIKIRTACDHIIILPYPANTRIRIKSTHNRISIGGSSGCTRLAIRSIVHATREDNYGKEWKEKYRSVHFNDGNIDIKYRWLLYL
jgi:hypothetical protein